MPIGSPRVNRDTIHFLWIVVWSCRTRQLLATVASRSQLTQISCVPWGHCLPNWAFTSQHLSQRFSTRYATRLYVEKLRRTSVLPDRCKIPFLENMLFKGTFSMEMTVAADIVSVNIIPIYIAIIILHPSPGSLPEEDDLLSHSKVPSTSWFWSPLTDATDRLENTVLNLC